MLDFALGAVIVALAIRGWWRGLLREAIALAVMVAGLLVAFRLSTPVGDIVESVAGVSPEAGRLIAGVVIFIAISVGVGIASAILHKGLRFVPGLPTLNRAAGAGFSVLATVAVATLALSLFALVSPPDAIARQIDASALAGYLTNPDATPQKVMGFVSGDRVLERLLSLREMTGARRVVGDGETVTLDPVPRAKVKVDIAGESAVLEMLNRERDAAGVDVVVASEPLAEIARAYAVDVYTSGHFSNESRDGITVADRLALADIPVVAADQVLSLAVSAEAAQEALFGDQEEAPVLTAAEFRRVGIGIAKGPLGVILVEVLAG